MNSKYWEKLEARLYQSASIAGANPDKAGAMVDKRLSYLYNRYELVAQNLIASGYTRVPDPNNQDFPDWFIAPGNDIYNNNAIITSSRYGGYMAVTSGPLPDYIKAVLPTFNQG